MTLEQKQLKEEDVIVSAVMPEDMPYIWKDIKWFLHRACKRSNGRHSVKTAYDQILNYDLTLWVVLNKEDNSYIGCATTRILTFPTGLKFLDIVHLGGSNTEFWIEKGWNIFSKWAKQNGCEGMQAIGRKGLVHLTSKVDDAWKSNAVLFEVKFEEDK